MGENKNKKQKIEISVDSLQEHYEAGVKLQKELEAMSANQVALRKKTEEDLRNDAGLKEHAENIKLFLEQGLLGNDDDRLYVLIEDVLEEVLDTVKEHSKNFLEMHASEEAKSVKAKIEKAREDFTQERTLYESVQVMLDHMGWDHSEVPAYPTLARGGRPTGSRSSSSGDKGVREFTYHFTRNGEKQSYDNVSRALWYSSKGSNGGAKEGRLTSEQFKKLLKDETGFDNEWAQNWEVELPNGTKLGFVREEKREASNPVSEEPTSSDSENQTEEKAS